MHTYTTTVGGITVRDDTKIIVVDIDTISDGNLVDHYPPGCTFVGYSPSTAPQTLSATSTSYRWFF